MADDLNDIAHVWPQALSLTEVGRGPATRRLVAGQADRARIAKALGLDGLTELEAELTVTPWLDGVRIEGRWKARVTQTCGVTLEPFDSDLTGCLQIRGAPAGSPVLEAPEEHDLDLDPEADDPPDVIDGDHVDLGAYVVEDLSLAIDPFPRKPGATFEAPAVAGEPSPFAVLAKLKSGASDA